MVLHEAGVLVRVSGPDPRGLKADGRAFYSMESGRTTLSASGFVCRLNLPEGGNEQAFGVVTSASILAPFIELDGADQRPTEKLLAGSRVDVCFESGRWVKCKLAKITKISEVSLASETLVGKRPKVQRGIDVGCIALLHFAEKLDTKTFPALLSSVHVPLRGDSLIVTSSPFGLVSPTVFQNSVTTGIVSNVVYSPSERSAAPVLYLTDARCLPGSEGGAVFNRAGRLVGVLAPAFERRDQTSLELGAIIPLYLFEKQLDLAFLKEPSNHSKHVSENEKDLIELEAVSGEVGSGGAELERDRRAMLVALRDNMLAIDARSTIIRSAKSVVLISIHSTWGSGVVVSRDGYILTCAHLFRPFVTEDHKTKRLCLKSTRAPISVSFRDSDQRQNKITRCTAELVFCSQGPVDLALIRVKDPDALQHVLQPINISPQNPSPGHPCIALGHAIFDPIAQLSCTVSYGVVSKVVPHPRDPHTAAILQTCASVFRGHSGGLLADMEGNLVGILTSNARHSNGSIIPTINFSVPVAMIQPLLDAVSLGESAREEVFDEYDRADPQLLALWRLECGFDPVDGPLRSSDFKNSRFSEFLNQFNAKL